MTNTPTRRTVVTGIGALAAGVGSAAGGREAQPMTTNPDLILFNGKIATLDRGANCTNQKYLVADALKSVSTPKTSNGSGNFSVTLTHYRRRLLGRCVAYKARVSGMVSFTY